MPCRRVPKSTRPFEGSPIPRRARSPSRSTAATGDHFTIEEVTPLPRAGAELELTRPFEQLLVVGDLRRSGQQQKLAVQYMQSGPSEMTYCMSMMQGSSSCDVEVYAKLERERIEIKVKNSNTKGEKHYTSKTKAPTKAPQKKDNFVARLDYAVADSVMWGDGGIQATSLRNIEKNERAAKALKAKYPALVTLFVRKTTGMTEIRYSPETPPRPYPSQSPSRRRSETQPSSSRSR